MSSKLSELEIARLIESELSGWSSTGEKIIKEWNFKDFIDAFSFMTKVALLSEAMNHHPELKNVYNHLSIELTTHDKGGITEMDIELARKIDSIDIE